MNRRDGEAGWQTIAVVSPKLLIVSSRSCRYRAVSPRQASVHVNKPAQKNSFHQLMPNVVCPNGPRELCRGSSVCVPL